MQGHVLLGLEVRPWLNGGRCIRCTRMVALFVRTPCSCSKIAGIFIYFIVLMPHTQLYASVFMYEFVTLLQVEQTEELAEQTLTKVSQVAAQSQAVTNGAKGVAQASECQLAALSNAQGMLPDCTAASEKALAAFRCPAKALLPPSTELCCFSFSIPRGIEGNFVGPVAQRLYHKKHSERQFLSVVNSFS